MVSVDCKSDITERERERERKGNQGRKVFAVVAYTDASQIALVTQSMLGSPNWVRMAAWMHLLTEPVWYHIWKTIGQVHFVFTKEIDTRVELVDTYVVHCPMSCDEGSLSLCFVTFSNSIIM